MSHKHIPPSQVDFANYKQSLIDHLKSYPQFTDYDFYGSNWSVLIDILTYNAFNLVHYDSMVGNEAWIDTAILRQSLVSASTNLNYLPRSRISARCIITVEVFPDDAPPSIILPKYYRFRAIDPSNNTIYFITEQDYIATRSEDGRYLFTDVVVYQGEIVEDYFSVDNVVIENGITYYQSPFVISSANVDINSLEVFVFQDQNDTTPTKYTYAHTLNQTTNQSTTYFLRGIYDNQYAIEFGDGTFGLPLVNGNIVLARYRSTQGTIVQGNYVLGKTTDIGGYSNIEITAQTRVQGGFERESIEEIRLNAPRYFQTQDRAVTDNDYQAIIKQNFPQIQQVSVFGGEQIQQYGKVMIVLKPFGTIGILPNFVKNQIIELLKTKNIVPEPIIINPLYFYIGISGNVFYSGDITTLTENQLRTNVINQLVNLNNNQIGNFNINVYQSLINDTIKNADNSIVGSDITMSLIRRWTPALNINETLNFTTNNAFKTSLDGAYTAPTDWTIMSTPFKIWYNNSNIDVAIQDDGIGNLFYFQIQPSGNRVKIGSVIGSVDYQNGAVNLVANVSQYNDYIAIYCTLREKSISVIRDVFVIIDGPDISIDMKRL